METNVFLKLGKKESTLIYFFIPSLDTRLKNVLLCGTEKTTSCQFIPHDQNQDISDQICEKSEA